MFQDKDSRVKFITRVGVMVALGVVLKLFFSPMIGSGIRINTYGAPIVVVGILFGPLAGGLTGYLVDLIYSLYHGFGAVPNFFTVSTILWGVIPGIFLFKRDRKSVKLIFLVVFLASLSELVFNTLGIYVLTTKGISPIDVMWANLPWRAAILVVLVPMNIYIIDIIYDRVLHNELMLVKENKAR